MKGTNQIIVTGAPKGTTDEGIVAAGETFAPGMIVQKDPTVALVGGKHTYKLYDRANDGDRPAGAYWVVTELLLTEQGKAITDLDTFDTYAAGDRVSVYAPLPGEQVNLLFKNVAGTADDVLAGDLLIADDGTSKVIVTTGSPQTEVAMSLEALTDPAADSLIWCEWGRG